MSNVLVIAKKEKQPLLRLTYVTTIEKHMQTTFVILDVKRPSNSKTTTIAVTKAVLRKKHKIPTWKQLPVLRMSTVLVIAKKE